MPKAFEAAGVVYYRPWMYEKQEEAIFNDARYAVVEASTKSGKAQPLDSQVFTPSGPKPMVKVVVGDEVLTPEGSATVIGVYPQGIEDVYEITFSDGTKARCSLDHLWEVHTYNKNPEVLTTKEIMDLPEWRFKKSWVPNPGCVRFESQEVPMDPYTLGILIADGGFTTETLRLSSADQQILGRVVKSLPEGMSLNKARGDNVDYTITDNGAESYNGRGNRYIDTLRNLNLWGLYSYEKFIPDVYKYNSQKVRFEILRGIFDGDGWINDNGHPRLSQTSERLSEDVREVIESLGGLATITTKETGYKLTYRLRAKLEDPSKLFWLDRKRNICEPMQRKARKKFRNIEKVSREETQCIELDSERQLYLTDNFIATHNTVGCIVWLFEQALMGEKGQNYWWVAPVSTQADIAWRRMKEAVPESIYETNESLKRMDLANGTSIWFKTGDSPDSLYGEDVYAAVVDEASRVKEESWHALRSTLTATKGPVRIIGNVKGKKNWAYRLARRAEEQDEQGNPKFSYDKITAYDAVEAGVLDPQEIEDAKATLPEHIFKELYLAEPADDEGNPFGIDHIRACIMKKANGEKFEAQTDFKLESDPVCWGWDVAKHVNYTVGIALDADGRVCRFMRFRDSYEATMRKVIANTKGRPALVDSTSGSGGDQLLERLQRKGGENYRGYKFSSGSKQNLMIGLAVAIQNKDISFPDGVIVRELESFEYEQKPSGNVVYSAPEGQHDDCVDALAMAVKHWRSRSVFPEDAKPILFDKVSHWNNVR